MSDFSHIDYSPELERMRDALLAIKNDYIEIEEDFSTIKDDIATLKGLGTSCGGGIYTTGTLNAYSRALALMSVRNEDQLQALIDELENPTEIPEV